MVRRRINREARPEFRFVGSVALRRCALCVSSAARRTDAALVTARPLRRLVVRLCTVALSCTVAVSLLQSFPAAVFRSCCTDVYH